MFFEKSLRRNGVLLCIFKSFQMALFPLAIITLFWTDHIGMSVTDIMLVQAILAGVMVVAEFPSGYIADRLGYRTTLIFAAIISSIGWSIYLFASSFFEVVLSEVLYGLSMALISGTDQALMYESLEEAGQKDTYVKWSGRIQGSGQCGEGIAAFTAATAYLLHVRLPFALEVGISVCNIFIACMLVEPQRKRPPFSRSFNQIIDICKHAFVSCKSLRYFMMLSLVFGLASFIPVWLIQTYARDAGASLQALSVNWAVANLVVSVGAFFSNRILGYLKLKKSLIACCILVAIGYLGLGLNEWVYGFMFYYALTFMRGVNGPILTAEIQKRATSDNRAGMLSLRSLVFRGVFIFVGPSIGYIVDSFGMHPAFLVCGGFLIALSCAMLFILHKKDYL